MRRGPRRLAILAGIACIALGAYAAVHWKEVEASWYLHSFRRRPGYLLQALQWQEGTRARAALESYAGTNEGQEALLRIALDLHPEWLEALEEPGIEGVVIGVFPATSSWYLCRWGEGRMQSVLEKLDASARARDRPWIFQRLAVFVADSQLPRALPEHPGRSFALWRENYGYKCSVDRAVGVKD